MTNWQSIILILNNVNSKVATEVAREGGHSSSADVILFSIFGTFLCVYHRLSLDNFGPVSLLYSGK